MLSATSDRAFGRSRLRTALLLERRFSAHFVLRDQLVFDSRFAAPSAKGTVSTLYLVLAGAVEVAGGAVFAAPCAFLLNSDELERVTPGSPTFRSWGAPSITTEIRLRADDVIPPTGLVHGPIVLGPATWQAIDAALRAFVEGVPVIPHVAPMFAGLVADGIIRAAASEIVDREPEDLRRVWSGFEQLFARQSTSAGVLELKRITGLSLRQLTRDIKKLAATFNFSGAGFRDTVKVLRLRSAAVLLSAPGATATDVAREVGYKSLEAMGRAFRDAKLPAPSAILDHVRYEMMPRL